MFSIEPLRYDLGIRPFFAIVPASVEGNFTHLYALGGDGFLSVFPAINSTYWLPVRQDASALAFAVLTHEGGAIGYENGIAQTQSVAWLEEDSGRVRVEEDGVHARSGQAVTGVALLQGRAYLMTTTQSDTGPVALDYLYRRDGSTWTTLKHPTPVRVPAPEPALAANATNLFVCLPNPDSSVSVTTLDADGGVRQTATVEPPGSSAFSPISCTSGYARQGVPAFAWLRMDGLDFGPGRITVWTGTGWKTETVAPRLSIGAIGGHGSDLFVAGQAADPNQELLFHSLGDGNWAPCALPAAVGFERARPGAQLYSAADGAWLAFIQEGAPTTPDRLVVAKLAHKICQS